MMMRIVVSCLLAFTTSASAECAWEAFRKDD
jgi:hypothetical protein